MKVIISRSESGTNAALFVGGLPQGITDRQIEDAIRGLERPPVKIDLQKEEEA